MRGELRDEILELLKKGPMTRDELRQAAKSCPDPKQVSNALFHLRVGGHVRKLDGKMWAIGDAAGAEGKPPSEGRAIAKRLATGNGRSTDLDFTPPEGVPVFKFRDPDAVEQILQKAADDAQAAIDEYVSRLGDPGILGPLRAARDQARLALENYRKARAA